jgi:hypothetical protein
LKKIVFIVIVFITACTKKNVVSTVNQGTEYYPTKIGKYVVYDVDSLVYVQLPKKDTLKYKYRIKEKLAENFTDNQGKQAIRMERYIKWFNPLKSYDSIPWKIKEVWMVNADANTIQVVESNVRYTKLVFPVVEKSSWNGNAFNSVGDWEFKYDYINSPETINGTKFNNVLLVNQKFYDTKISQQNYNEKYAAEIGLVSRQIIDILSNSITAQPILKRIETGVVYTQNYVSSGYE